MSILSEVMTALNSIPMWKRLNQLPEELKKLEERITALENQIKGTGEVCPYCRKTAGDLIKIEPAPIFGDFGVKIFYYHCTSCNKDFDKQSKD